MTARILDVDMGTAVVRRLLECLGVGSQPSRFVWAPHVLHAMNDNTRRTYTGALQRLQDWLDGRRLTDERLAEWIQDMARRGCGAASAIQCVAAVRYFARHHGYRSPNGVRTAAAIARMRTRNAGRRRGQFPCATRSDVDTLFATALEPRTHSGGQRESAGHAKRRGLFELALIAVLYMGALRVAEAASLRWNNVTDAEDGNGVLIWLRRSKSNPYGAESDVRFLKGVLANALRQWRVESGTNDDASFVFGGLTPATLSRRLIAAVRAAGIKKRLTAHSFRVGLAVELTRLGASMQEIMHAGNWKSPTMVSHYSAAARAEGGAVGRLM